MDSGSCIKTQMNKINESRRLIQIINRTYDLYIKYGARSPKKVDYFHSKIKEILQELFPNDNVYLINLEHDIPSCNSTGKKKCDIVILKYDKPYIIFPVKIIMSNFKQNKNNGWENLTGEIIHIKWSNPDINIIPINIFMSQTPYLNNNHKITKFENITIDDIENYNILKQKKICYDIINYIVDIKHDCIVGDVFAIIPSIIQYNKCTQYRSFYEILKELL